MKLFFTFLILCFSFTVSNAQSLTGIWRGSFEQSNLDINQSKFLTETYKYEVQINNLINNALEGVTYSYQTTRFFGKAALKGIYAKKNKTLTIKETMMIEVRSAGKTIPCLMTCYLDYSKSGKLETLTGTYSSINETNNNDCGSGTVYLEKVAESDFELENFLAKNKKKVSKNEGVVRNSNTIKRPMPTGKNFENNTTKKVINPKSNVTAKAKISPTIKQPQNTVLNPNLTANNKKKTYSSKEKTTKPGAAIFVVKNNKKNKIDSTVVVKNNEPKTEIKTETVIKKIEEPVAEVLKERENKLVNSIVVDTKDVILEFYDNGEIDGDTISVYKDNKLIIDKRRLSLTPIVMNLHFDEFNTFYELITVAENLGEIPPNTALMVMSYGNKRKEIFLTSDEKNNAKLIIEYKK